MLIIKSYSLEKWKKLRLAKTNARSWPYLEPISAGARQHFVDAQHVEGVDADPDVELVLRGVLHHVLKKRPDLKTPPGMKHNSVPKTLVSKKLECFGLQSWSAHSMLIIIESRCLLAG